MAALGGGKRETSGIDRILVPGILSGMAAAVAMGLLAMIAAATYQHRGFFTPMYQITALLGDGTIERSVQAAARGSLFLLVPEPMLFGVAMHLLIGGFFGGMFALVARAVPARLSLVVVGPVFGLVVLVVMSLALVPLADAAMSGDRRIPSYAGLAGWWTFTVAHVIYGLVLGLWSVWRPQDFSREEKRPKTQGP